MNIFVIIALLFTNFFTNLLSYSGVESQIIPSELNTLDLSDDIIRGINWFGFETQAKSLQCLWVNDIEWNLTKIKNLGFNNVRLPFSVEFVFEGDFHEMDIFFDKAKEKNIGVTLDCHRLHSTHQSAKPYDSHFTFDDFLESWRIILDRYQHYENLVNIDIFNEFQSENYVEWTALARQIVNFIEKQFPERFTFFVGGVSWGGNLHNVDLSDLPFHDRIRYSLHKYWFSDTTPYNEKWDYSFGNNKPVMNIGEWGYISENENEAEWALSFVNYLIEKNIRDTFFWTWSFNSIDTKGILYEDCTTVNEDKMALLYYLWKE